MKALDHAHAKGIIHRDIKSQNILILKDGTIKVADFGIAALESAQEKKSGQALGSVHYIAPEQARGDTPDAGAISTLLVWSCMRCSLERSPTAAEPRTRSRCSILTARRVPI